MSHVMRKHLTMTMSSNLRLDRWTKETFPEPDGTDLETWLEGIWRVWVQMYKGSNERRTRTRSSCKLVFLPQDDHIEAQEAVREFIRLKYVEKKWCKPQSRNLQKRSAWNCTASPKSSHHSIANWSNCRCPKNLLLEKVRNATWQILFRFAYLRYRPHAKPAPAAKAQVWNLGIWYNYSAKKRTYFQKVDGWKTTFFLTWTC